MRRLLDITLAATRRMGVEHRSWTDHARAGELLEELGTQAIPTCKRMLAALEAVEREGQQETGT